jgi:hypothetical protein
MYLIHPKSAAKIIYVQQFGNPDNPALEESSPKTESFVFYQTKA